MPIDATAFRKAMGQFATGVTVVTTRNGEGRPLGLTVNAFCSVSLSPPLVLVCVDQHSEANAGFLASGLFGVSVLAQGQEEVSRRFARSGAKKFDDVPFSEGTQGLPLVAGAVAHVECRVASTHPGGDHLIYVGEVLNLHVFGGRPLLFHGGGYQRLAPGGGPT